MIKIYPMKRVLFSIITLLGVFALASCDKDETQAIYKEGTPTFTAANNPAEIVIDKTDPTKEVTFNWTAADYGYQASVSYYIQFDVAGNGFKNASTLAVLDNATSYSISYADLNAKFIGINPAPANPQKVNYVFRIGSKVSDATGMQYSDSLAIAILPFYVKIIYPLLFVPGGSQTPNAWTPGDSATAIGSVKFNTNYEGYIYFKDDNAQFKYTVSTGWDNNYGDTGADGTLDAGGDNILTNGLAGLYKLNVDLAALTHMFMRTDWGIIGDATSTGWDSDQNLTYNPDTKLLTITLDLTVGGIKFRANDGWDLNYGDTGADGILDEGGDNISVGEAGNYTVTLDLSTPVYKYTLKKN